jgi:3-oxoadipate enol-lactonase
MVTDGEPCGATREEGGGMRVVTDDGVGLEAVEQGSGPTLVLVHGFGGAKEDFADQVDALASRNHVVTFDHRGHGESDAPTDAASYSLNRLALDTMAVADAVGAEQFLLLGHSMGGMVARRLVLAHPQRVEALVLMDTSPGPVPGLDGELVELAAEVALTQGMTELKRLMDAFQPLATPAYERLMEERPGYQEFNDRKWAALSAVMWATLGREIRDQPDELAALGAVNRPTLVIVGAQDEPFVGVSRDMAETIPGAELVVIPDAGHSPQFENPAAWLRALERFLRAPVRESPAA